MTIQEKFSEIKNNFRLDSPNKSDIDELVMYAYYKGRADATKENIEEIRKEFSYSSIIAKKFEVTG